MQPGLLSGLPSNRSAIGSLIPMTAALNKLGCRRTKAYELINDTTVTPAQRLVTRQDINTKQISQLANRIDALQFEFLDAAGGVVTPDKAVKVRITVTVSLPSVGTPRSPGYQPPTRMQLRSEATLRNSLLKQ